jgi:hypothetical protein
MTWRTMESVPRDGTRVLVIATAPGPRVAIAHWDGYTWDDGRDNVKPTHWQPLPSTDLTAPCPVVEARIQGMREGFHLAYDRTGTECIACGEDLEYDDACSALDAAIAELREGKR